MPRRGSGSAAPGWRRCGGKRTAAGPGRAPRHWILIRRSLSDPADLASCYCHPPEGRPVSLPVLIKVAGKRRPARKRSRPERTHSAGTSPRCAPGTASAGTPPWPPSPSSAMSPSATDCAATSPSRPRQPPAATTLPKTAPGKITADATTGARPTTLTWASRSATRPSPPGPGALPARHRRRQAHRRRDRPPDPPRPPARRRAHHRCPPRLSPALVPVAAPPPGPRPMAPLRHPPGRRSQHLTKDGRKEVTRCNRKPEPITSQYATRRTRTAKARLYY